MRGYPEPPKSLARGTLSKGFSRAPLSDWLTMLTMIRPHYILNSRYLPISIPVFPLLFLLLNRIRKENQRQHRQPRKVRLCGRANLGSPVHEHLDALLENRATGSIAQFDVVIAGLQPEFLEFAHSADEAAIHVDACVLQAAVDLH